MTEILLCILITNGIADILTRQYVFQWWRDWVYKTFPYNDTFNTFVNCPICVSFWVGFIIAALFFPEVFAAKALCNSFFAGVISALTADIIFSKIGY